MRLLRLWSVALLALLALPSVASAYTTRVHIVMANEVREALIASGDGTIELRWSGATVRLPPEDADAIVNQPLAFRAGAIGPDNTVFPGMTDGSHGVHQDPYGQCELLYMEAITEVERAYALGCFLHGATDAVAHHFVNDFTGETFTLNPRSEGRLSSFDNVVGHIVTESRIQDAVRQSDPTALSESALRHDIPESFVLRAYYDVDSPVWQRLAEGALERWEAARAASPDGNLLSWAGAAGLASWEHVAMAPVYLSEIQRLRVALRAFVEAEIADLSDPSSTRGRELGVTAGDDGMVGTPDDDTACSGSCPTLFGRYYVYVNLLAPRTDAGGRPLPSAFDAISDRLGDDLNLFLPALMAVIGNLSNQLNAPITDDADHGLDVSPSDVAAIFAPLDDWATRTTSVDYELLGRAVTPVWYQNLSDFFDRFGVSISIPEVLAAVLEPLIREVREVLVDSVRAEAETYVIELAGEYRAGRDGFSDGLELQLAASAPDTLGGHALEFFQDSGLWNYSFNITAATFANHDVLLSGDPIGEGAASFDASYTLEWTQLGLCDYLQAAVFPEGTGIGPLLSVHDGETFHMANIDGDAPVECHDGDLELFGMPSVDNCRLVGLDELTRDPHGSLSRAFPPTYASGDATCRRLTVPGLPAPPPLPDGGMGGGDGGASGGDGGGPGGDGGPGSGEDSGCGCAVPGGASGSPLGLLFALAGLLFWRRRGQPARRSRAAGWAKGWIALGALALALGGCDDGVVDPPTDGSVTPMDGGGDDAGPGPDDSGVIDEDAGDEDGGVGVDGGPDLRRALLDALGASVWSGLQTRSEGGSLVERAYELRFDAATLEWAEIRNPWGPGRQRIFRSFSVDRDGETVDSTVMIPSGWETPPELNGQRDTWTFEVVDGSPRELRITDDGGVTEVVTEGAIPAPVEGLTAELRVFAAGGTIEDAACRGSTINDADRRLIWEFARGRGTMSEETGYDFAAGVAIEEWVDSPLGSWSVTDVDGFGRLGGTALSNQFNFVVRYTGSLDNPGTFWLREADDDVNDAAVWAFAGASVGSMRPADLLLEVQDFFNADATPNEVSFTGPAGPVPVEIILTWCPAVSHLEPTTFQASLDATGAAFDLLPPADTTPITDAALFPPAL